MTTSLRERAEQLIEREANVPVPYRITTIEASADTILKLLDVVDRARMTVAYLDGLAAPAVWEMSTSRRLLVEALAALSESERVT